MLKAVLSPFKEVKRNKELFLYTDIDNGLRVIQQNEKACYQQTIFMTSNNQANYSAF